jgi:16S rRNA (guanine527-N7)-methyltransferase
MEILKKYFHDLTPAQIAQFERLGTLVTEWNEKINVISRKDIESLYEKHILHSLAIAKIISFRAGSKILDVGTGGGFPGIPLAILFPACHFVLIDSIGKKIKVVQDIAEKLGLVNVTAIQTRVEEVKETFDFVVSRAVTSFPDFVSMVRKNISKTQKNSRPNGIIYLKGGDFQEEIKPFKQLAEVDEIKSFFEEPFFETKKIVYLPVNK